MLTDKEVRKQHKQMLSLMAKLIHALEGFDWPELKEAKKILKKNGLL